MTCAALWTWLDGARYLRAYSTAGERQAEMERVLEGRKGYSDVAVECSDGSWRNLGTFDEAETVDIVERRRSAATSAPTPANPPPPPGFGSPESTTKGVLA